MVYPWAGFVLGLFGSLHCVGMCGPIVMMLPGRAGGVPGLLAGQALYSLGRTITYATLGLVLGIVGQSIALAGYQQALSVITGMAMILAATLPLPSLTRWSVPGAVRRLGQLLANRSDRGRWSTWLVIGLLNGLLPCGLVYAALAAAVAGGNVTQTVLFMACFGAGTVPALLITALGSQIIAAPLRHRITQLFPVGLALLGVLLILRGMGLDIPYLSPDLQQLPAH